MAHKKGVGSSRNGRDSNPKNALMDNWLRQVASLFASAAQKFNPEIMSAWAVTIRCSL